MGDDSQSISSHEENRPLDHCRAISNIDFNAKSDARAQHASSRAVGLRFWGSRTTQGGEA